MAKERKIVSLTTNGITLLVNKPVPEEMPEWNGRVVREIEFKRDSVYGIAKGALDEAQYFIELANPMTDKDVAVMAIPYHATDRIVIMTLEKDDGDTTEIAENMREAE